MLSSFLFIFLTSVSQSRSAWGMTSQRVTAMEQDMDRIEQALIMFTKMDSRIAVIETEVKNINKKLDNMKN